MKNRKTQDKTNNPHLANGRNIKFLGATRWLIRTLIFAVFQAVALLWGSGQPSWVMAWIYIGVFVLVQIVTLVALLRVSPDLLIERAAVQQGTKDWDQILARLVALVGPLAIWIVAGLDKRYAWSPEISIFMKTAFLLALLGGGLLTAWAMSANTFFSGTVRIQKERGHTVVTNGPYRIVRHPGYLGGLIYNLASPVALGALWACFPAILTCVLLFVRTALEDKILKIELYGYMEYTQKVRFRLIPGIW